MTDTPPIDPEVLASRIAMAKADKEWREYQDSLQAPDEYDAAYEAARLQYINTPWHNETASNKFHYIKATDIQPSLDVNDFVQGLLENGKLSVVYGPSNCGKTFFITDLCFHIALGWRWRERRVEKGGILYVAMEGSGGLNNRVAAFKQRYNELPSNFGVVPCHIDMLDPNADLPAFIELVKQAAAEFGDLKMIVIDTLARAIAGGDENSGEDMGRLIKHCTELQQTTGSHVCLIHHSGKDQAKGARGWSGLRAAIDTEIEINREPEATYSTVKAVKQRDLPMDFDAAFILERQVLGENRYGEEVSSCTVQVWDAPANAKSDASLPAIQDFVFEAIKHAVETNGKKVNAGNENYILAIDYEELWYELDKRGFKSVVRDDETDEQKIQEKVKSATQVARLGLRKKKLIDFDRKHIWLK